METLKQRYEGHFFKVGLYLILRILNKKYPLLIYSSRALSLWAVLTQILQCNGKISLDGMYGALLAFISLQLSVL